MDPFGGKIVKIEFKSKAYRLCVLENALTSHKVRTFVTFTSLIQIK